MGPQETELRKRFAMEEEAVGRQAEALKARQRALERDIARTRESIEKVEKEQAAVMQTLESDYRHQEESLLKRSEEQEVRLRQRLEERRIGPRSLCGHEERRRRPHPGDLARQRKRTDRAGRPPADPPSGTGGGLAGSGSRRSRRNPGKSARASRRWSRNWPGRAKNPRPLSRPKPPSWRASGSPSIKNRRKWPARAALPGADP